MLMPMICASAIQNSVLSTVIAGSRSKFEREIDQREDVALVPAARQ